MSNPEAQARVGTVVGGYRLEAAIASGAMTTVYRARTPDGRRVAVKIPLAEYAADPTFRARFLREARIAGEVSNPHLVPVIDAGEEEEVSYLVQPLVMGGSLEDRLRRDGRLDVPSTVALCAHVAEALEALWAVGVIHRDVKPGNILLDRDGRGWLTDLGLAKSGGESPLTQTGDTVGSIAYMAPEQIQADPVTPAADVYSLGCVIFECIDGQPPFGAGAAMKTLWAHLQQEPPTPGAGRPDVSPLLARAITRALAKAPEDRPPGARAYARTLARRAAVPVGR